MNRRTFLKTLSLAAPAAAVAPTYFFAPIGGWESEVIHNPHAAHGVLTGEARRLFVQQLRRILEAQIIKPYPGQLPSWYHAGPGGHPERVAIKYVSYRPPYAL